MAAFDPATLDRWRALAIVDRDGTTVGTINEFYLDRETGYPTWALVNTGLFGTSQTFVPLVHATEISDGLQVPYEKRHIKDTPKVDLHDELSPDEEAALFAHYGVDYQVPPADAEPDPGEASGSVPADPGSVDPDAASAPSDFPEPVPDEPGTEDGPVAPSSSDPGDPGDPGDPVPDEPGTTTADNPTSDEPTDGTGSTADTASPVEHPDLPDHPAGTESSELPPEPDLTEYPVGTEASEVPPEPDLTEYPVGTEASEVPPDPNRADQDLDPTQAAPGDPDLGRTAPVAQGLPGSTAASPYGDGPATVDKDADPSELSAGGVYRPPAEAGWSPGAAGSFEEHEPAEQPAGASDRWREAKLAAERDRISRAAAAQPEERSPLERARRRLERLVGGGQDHPDPEDISPADRDAAERARRARLGLDDEDHRRRDR